MDKIDPMSKALKSPDEETRLQGLRDLAANRALERLDLIFEAFGDASWRVRKEAIDLFLKLPVSHDLVGEIIELLHAEENAGLRNAAVEILSRMGRTAVPMLLDQATCADHDVRKFIVDILGDIAAPEAIPTLIGALQDADSNVRAAAAENLGKLKATQAVPALLEAMQHPDLLLQFTILDALSHIAAPISLAQLLPFKDEKLLRKALIDCLGKAGDASAISELVVALADSMRNVRETAVLALVEIAARHPEQVKQHLAEGAKDRTAAMVTAYLAEEYSPALRRAAARILGWLGAVDTVEPLLGLLEFETLQQEAMAALVDIGRVNPSALLAAWPTVSGNRRACLAYILGESRCREGLPLLLQGLRDGDQQIVSMSAHALGRTGAAEVLPELVVCLQSGAAEVQETAAQALATLGRSLPKETFAGLRPLLSHADPKQRMLAVTILRELDDADVLKALRLAIKDPAAEVRRAAVKVFERHDAAEMVGTLLLALTDEDAEVRRSIVEILAGCDAEEALDGLQLALQDEDIWVRSAAVRGLGRLGGERSRVLVEKAISDPVGLVSIAALETLAGLLCADATPHLVAALDHADEDVVAAAMNLLARYGAGDWLQAHADRLLNHPYWMVRTQIARNAVEVLGVWARPLLEKRLAVETEALVRQQLTDLLEELPVS